MFWFCFVSVNFHGEFCSSDPSLILRGEAGSQLHLITLTCSRFPAISSSTKGAARFACKPSAAKLFVFCPFTSQCLGAFFPLGHFQLLQQDLPLDDFCCHSSAVARVFVFLRGNHFFWICSWVLALSRFSHDTTFSDPRDSLEENRLHAVLVLVSTL